MMQNQKKAITAGIFLLATGFGVLSLTGLNAYAAPKAEKQAESQARLVNLNQASAQDLVGIQGIGPAIAERILQYRQEHGRFEKVEDLGKIHGIGEAKFQKIKSQVTI